MPGQHTRTALGVMIFCWCLFCLAGPLRKLTTHVAHVLPVSDDGGSTAEIVRVIGGPAVGDIRSRCLRLADDRDEEVRGRALGCATWEASCLSKQPLAMNAATVGVAVVLLQSNLCLHR